MKTMTSEECHADLRANGAKDCADLVMICPTCGTPHTGNDLIRAADGNAFDDVEKSSASRASVMSISRVWSMPSPLTFTVKPIRAFVDRWIRPVSVDCFARDCTLADITNDLNPATAAAHHMDVLDFAEWMNREAIRPACILFDPPYSPRQAADCYEAAGVDPRTLQAVKRRKGNAWQRTKNWKEERDALANLQSPGDVVLSFGWDSCGMGKKRGYALAEVLLVCHGACHNDTICIAEIMVSNTNLSRGEPAAGET